MRKNHTTAFTLVELIVVITILAILGSIVFISLNGYANTARNSKRVSDIKLIGKSLSLYLQVEALYPNPDNATNISYSGGLAWTQGVFGSGVISQIGRLSEVPKDPVFGNEYTYSVLANRKRFQIAGLLEDGFFAYTNPLLESSYALSQDQMKSYVSGDYSSPDLTISSGAHCYTVSSPSLILSDIPVGGLLEDSTNYSYSFTKSSSLPSSYTGGVKNNGSNSLFQVRELLDSCSITDVEQLNLFVAKLSTSFQGLVNFGDYENLIFNSNSLSFKKDTVHRLMEQGISISPEVLKTLHNETPSYSFVDSFTDSDGVQLVGIHSPDTLASSWSFLGTSTPSAYSISGNSLRKNSSSELYISPISNPTISSGDYSLGFTVQDFAGGTISAYLRYIDDNNYYKLNIYASGFQLIEKIGGVESAFITTGQVINSGDAIVFSLQGNTLILSIKGIEVNREDRSSALSAKGKVAISLQNNGASIDDFTFIYK